MFVCAASFMIQRSQWSLWWRKTRREETRSVHSWVVLLDSFHFESSWAMILISTSLQFQLEWKAGNRDCRLKLSNFSLDLMQNGPLCHFSRPPRCALALIIITRDRLTVNWEKFMSFCAFNEANRVVLKIVQLCSRTKESWIKCCYTNSTSHNH